jgi:hypothetical protein
MTPEERETHIRARNARKSQRWRAANPEKHREQVKEWRKDNPDRVRVYDTNNRNKNREKRRKTWREWARAARLADPQMDRRSSLKKLYNLTIEQYDALLAAQNGQCAICRRDTPGNGRHKFFHVDHDHTTGAVRQLLCHGCNTGLGAFKDNPDLLRAAAAYLSSLTKP